MRACCYCRTSTLDQAREEKVSIPDQINWARTFALEKGWSWTGEYIEPGVTGDTEPDQREALSRLLVDARDNKFDILLIYHSSRLAREPDIGMRVCRVLGQLRKQVYFRNAPIDPVLPDKFTWGLNVGSQYMTAFSFIGDFQENVARSERVRSGFQGLAKRGILVFAPYGYKKISRITDDGYGRQKYAWQFETDPPKSLVVQRIFREYLGENGSIRSIMLRFNKERVPSPTGRISDSAWSGATIKNILSNPVYTGKVRWGRKLGGKYLQGKSLNGKQRRIMTTPDKWTLIEGKHPKVIEGEVFKKVQDKLKLRYVLKGRAVASKGLLTGLVKCGRCGKNAYFRDRRCTNKKYRDKRTYFYACGSYYRSGTCKRHLIGAIKLHKIVIDEIHKIASNPNYREKLLQKSGKDNNQQLIQQSNLLNKSLDVIKEKQFRILNAYENNVLRLEEFGEAKGKLDAEAIRTTEEIEKINTIIIDKSRAEKAKEIFSEVLKDFKRNFEKAELSKQKELVQSLIFSVVVKSNSIQINYRI